MKNQTKPASIQTFIKIFDLLALKHSASQVFTHFLEMIIANASFDFENSVEKNYNKEDRQIFNQLFYEYVRVMEQEIVISGKKWFDLFGILFEYIGLSSDRNGQFFTPEPICDFMADIMVSDDTGINKRIADQACGSGRLLLAANTRAPGNLLIAADIDQKCCLMTVCNFFFHGCLGEVVWCNSLFPNSYFGGWKLTKGYTDDGILLPVPIIKKMEKEESVFFNNRHEILNSKKEISSDYQEQVNKNHNNNAFGQLSLF